MKTKFKQIIAFVLMFLIITSTSAYGQVTGTTDETLKNQEIPPGEDILINVAEYQPKVVPEQAFNTDDYKGYTVYALLNGIQTNPFIDVTKIRTINARVRNTNLPGVQVAYRSPPYSRYSLENMGLVLIRLPTIKDSRKIPKTVEINMSTTILYDIGSGFGVGETGFSIPQLTEQEFSQNKDKYSFWAGRGYVKADLIEDGKVTLTIYDGRSTKVRSGLTLTPGQESGEISLDTGYFLPQYGENALESNIRDRFKIKLDSIGAVNDKVKMQILLDNRFISAELSKNQRIYGGSSWKVDSITKSGSTDVVKLSNVVTNELVTITGSTETLINCGELNDDKSACNLIPECSYDDVTNRCVSLSSKSNQVSVSSQILSSAQKTQAKLDLQAAKNRFDQLKSNPSSNLKDYTDVVDLFIKIKDNYKNSIYEQTARLYIAKRFYNELNYNDRTIKEGVTNYIAEYLSKEGFGITIAKDDSSASLGSDDYYKKAIESYEHVIQNQPEEGENLALNAQRKIAELYDYYLNDAENAIIAYNNLINTYGLTSLEKINYESRIKFLEVTRNYKSQPVDLYEDGSLVRIVLNGINVAETKPVAYISMNNDNAVAYKEGNVIKIIGSNEQFTLESVDSNKVVLVSNQKNQNNQNVREELLLDRNKVLSGVNFKLVRLETNREARITIKPVLKALTSVSNFQVHIPIERRAIQLSDSQIDSHVAATRKLIDSLDSAITKVNKIYEVLNYYCLSVISILLLKNIIQGFGGRHLARQEVLKEWESTYGKQNLEKKIFANAAEFDEDVSKMNAAIDTADEAFDKIKDNLDNCNQISDATLRKYCEIAKGNLDEDEEIILEDELRAALLKKEQAKLEWGTLIRDNPEKDLVKNSIQDAIQSDLNFRSKFNIQSERKNLADKFFKDGKPIENYDDIINGDVAFETSLRSRGITKAYWDSVKDKESLIKYYLDGEEKFITNKAYSQNLQDVEYYKDLIGKDELDPIVETKLTELKNSNLFKEIQSPLSNPLAIANLDTSSPSPFNRLDVGASNTGDYYIKQNIPIYIGSIEPGQGGSKQLIPYTLKNYLEKDAGAKSAFNNGNFNALQQYLSSKEKYLVISDRENKFKSIEVKDAFVPQLKYAPKITVEDSKLKTITVNAGYYLEAKRNSQYIITELSLWKTPSEWESGGYVKTFAVSKCREELLLGKYATVDEASKACSNLNRIDRDILNNPDKIKSEYTLGDGLKYTITCLRSDKQYNRA